MDLLLIVARLLLAAVFAVAAVTKLADRDGSRQGLLDFGLPYALAGPLGLVLPLAELAVAVTLLPPSTAWWGGIGALALLILFIAGIGFNLAHGRTPDCRCFGQLRSAPVGRPTLIRNGALALVAAVVVSPGPAAQPSIVDWLAALTTTQLLIVGFGLLGFGLLIAIAWLLSQLIGQSGRVLLRLDALEARLGAAPAHLSAEPTPRSPVPNGKPAETSPQGPPVGAKAPPFELPSLEGEAVSLEELRGHGRPVVLLFMDPGCGPCNALLPDVAGWQREHADEARLVVVSRGSQAANRAKFTEHGVGNVLLQREYEVADAFRAHGTPAGVLVRADGMVGSPVALGADQIRTLIWSSVLTPLPFAATSGSESRGLPIGEPAPALTFSDLDGGTLSLVDLRGSRTLLMFWSNGCGFCQQMLPELQAWDANPPNDAPKLVLVSRGTPDEHRALGLRSPVLLDNDSAAGDAFGASGTPMAVLLDQDGKVASDLAVGADEVLALAGAQATAKAARA